MVQASIKEQKSKKSENEFVQHQKKAIDDKPKGGLFNMFD